MFHIAVILLFFLLLNALSIVCGCINAEITIAIAYPAYKQSNERWLGRISWLKPRNIKNVLSSYAKRLLDKPQNTIKNTTSNNYRIYPAILHKWTAGACEESVPNLIEKEYLTAYIWLISAFSDFCFVSCLQTSVFSNLLVAGTHCSWQTFSCTDSFLNPI